MQVIDSPRSSPGSSRALCIESATEQASVSAAATDKALQRHKSSVSEKPNPSVAKRDTASATQHPLLLMTASLAEARNTAGRNLKSTTDKGKIRMLQLATKRKAATLPAPPDLLPNARAQILNTEQQRDD